ncbi:RNA polymerase sigma-70 factor (ECF subfamily) [Herbihabitans rhizosphaerae]|uniref:RNA polymerase sigma-70 factor (ECF subfamily) n=1 Tax=Herbihabitans rhizosphaerae TaxID=1872711 RepID=A0A4Q7KP59_9PSEU|nr:sigma-70 family RNA polymerase sigma factor [Herbihabitans rhizosphaerae]RZS37770.1 RNA polymerase sigma-70 factor (ECF subfamily) [Herbihabitans rhizosphaerae]
MDENFLAEQFEEHRARLKSVAYRMLGSLTDADDAVQEAWLKVRRADTDEVANLGAWLTTVVGRVCLDMLRSRRSRREEPLETQTHLPDPVVTRSESTDPEQRALLSDSVGIALLVVLESLGPAERLAFVLHDMFGVSFDEIAPIVGRTPAAARKMASRARQRVRGSAPTGRADLGQQRKVVDAFLAAARGGDIAGLISVLDPDVVLRSDVGMGAVDVISGAETVATQAAAFRHAVTELEVFPAVVNGNAGVVSTDNGVPRSVLSFTVVGDKIVEIDIIADQERLAGLDVSALR